MAVLLRMFQQHIKIHMIRQPAQAEFANSQLRIGVAECSLVVLGPSSQTDEFLQGRALVDEAEGEILVRRAEQKFSGSRTLYPGAVSYEEMKTESTALRGQRTG